MIQSFKIKFPSFLVLLFTITLLSCNDDDINPIDTPGTNEAINNWIYDQMEIYYYWEDQMPGKNVSNLNPDDYFNSLVYSQEDEFSWIQPNFQELINSLQGVSKEAGYEITFYADGSVPNGVIGQISYVKKESPASQKDLKRGDVFTEINGTRLTVDNYRSLFSETIENHTLKLFRYNETTDNFDELGPMELNTIEFPENPNFLDTVYTVNNKKIGYYVYNFFATGTDSNNDLYENEMAMIFQNFKNDAIQHLIVDLRYNSGGAETATIDLASHIGVNITEQDIFVKRDYNDLLTQAYRDRSGDSEFIKKFESKAANVGAQLENQSVTILTSRSSASASELLINGLLPYMQVFLIGETTYGKNVGSYTIYDDKDPENDWGMQPIVTKSFNSLDQSDYGNGFTPNIELSDNDLVKKELGDINERLLARAIQEITGVVARDKQTSRQQIADDIYSSLESKRSFGIYTIELPMLD